MFWYLQSGFRFAFFWAVLIGVSSPSAWAQNHDWHLLQWFEETRFEEGDPEMRMPRSGFSFLPESLIWDFMDDYEETEFEHFRRPPMRVQSGSPAARDSELAFLLMDIRLIHRPLSSFSTRYLEEHSEYPAMELQGSYVHNRMVVTENLLYRFLDRVSWESPAIAESAGPMIENLAIRMRTLDHELYEYIHYPPPHIESIPYYKRIRRMFELSKIMENEVSGLLGELYMAIALPGTFEVGKKVEQIPVFADLLEKKWPDLVKVCEAKPELFKQFWTLYPTLFDKITPDQPVKEVLKSLKNRVKREDVDVIRKVDGVYYWGESKLNYHPLDRVSLSWRSGFNTVQDQIRSKAEIAKLFATMGVDVRLEFMAAGGVSRDFANELHTYHWRIHTLGPNPLERPPPPDCSDLLK